MKKPIYSRNCLKRGNLARKREMHFMLDSNHQFLPEWDFLFVWNGIIDFSTNRYIHNIKIKHLHGTYIYEKQQIKLFSSNSLLIDKLNLKITRKMLSQIGSHSSLLFSLVYHRQFYHKITTGFPFLSFLFYQGNIRTSNYLV